LLAQTGGGSGGELQQKIAAVKQSVAENQQKLHQYQWTETTKLTRAMLNLRRRGLVERDKLMHSDLLVRGISEIEKPL
jgi:hypothetical protein